MAPVRGRKIRVRLRERERERDRETEVPGQVRQEGERLESGQIS